MLLTMFNLRTARGRSLPLGATASADGVNFVILCRSGTAVWLMIYSLESDQPLAEIPLDAWKNRTGNPWHIAGGGLPPAFRYGWRVDGPKGPRHRFDPSVVLLDPACTAVSDAAVWGRCPETQQQRSIRRSLFFRRPFN